MKFFECESEYESIPEWADFLIRFGYHWQSDQVTRRRIGLISLPCDSAAAGLLTLGAVIRDLESVASNNLAQHFDTLLRSARQFLESCRDCDLDSCDPKVRRCGHSKRAEGVLKKEGRPTINYEVSERTNFEERRLALVPSNNTNLVEFPTTNHSLKWHVRGEPPLHATAAEGALPAEPYVEILGSKSILSENLRASYSGLCFAGRSTGAARSRTICEDIWFLSSHGDYNLAELLTIRGWSQRDVSRVALYNPRTGRTDHGSPQPNLVVCDGDGAFLAAASAPEFQQSDLLGVVDRTIDRDRLEAVGAKIASLNQWYESDEDLLERLSGMPRGLSVIVLRRR